MIAKVTKRIELGPFRAVPTVRHARVERGNVNDCEVGGVLRRHKVLEYPWVACLADDLSDPMVIAATDGYELGHGFVSGTLGFPEPARASE